MGNRIIRNTVEATSIYSSTQKYFVKSLILPNFVNDIATQRKINEK